jgi:hypothetical protein
MEVTTTITQTHKLLKDVGSSKIYFNYKHDRNIYYFKAMNDQNNALIVMEFA